MWVWKKKEKKKKQVKRRKMCEKELKLDVNDVVKCKYKQMSLKNFIHVYGLIWQKVWVVIVGITQEF